MKKVIFSIFAILLLVGVASATTLHDYPDLLVDNDEINTLFVVGENAPASDVIALTDIMTSMAYDLNLEQVPTGLAVFDIDVEEEDDQNLVLIGNPDDNELTAEFLDQEDYDELGTNEGLIQLYNNGDYNAIVVVGGSYESTRLTAQQLALGNGLEGNRVLYNFDDQNDISSRSYKSAVYSNSEKQLQIRQINIKATPDHIKATISIRNKGPSLDDIKITAIAQELDAHRSTGPFDLRRGESVTKTIVLDLDDFAAPGMYDLMISASSNDYSHSTVREFAIA